MFRLQKERVKKDNILFSGGSIQQVFQNLIVLQVQPDPRTQHIQEDYFQTGLVCIELLKPT